MQPVFLLDEGSHIGKRMMKWKGSVFGLDRIFIREMKNWSHISWNLLVSAEMYIIVKAIKGIRGERMKKNLLMIIMAMVMCFSFAACGGGGNDEKDDGIDPNATITKEQYQQLREDNWSEMTPKEMEQYLGVKYVENKETEDWGEGYLVVDFPGPDEDSFLRVLFKDKEGNGKMTPSSMSPSGQLMGD